MVPKELDGHEQLVDQEERDVLLEVLLQGLVVEPLRVLLKTSPVQRVDVPGGLLKQSKLLFSSTARL